MDNREQNRLFTDLDLINARLFYSKVSSPKIYSAGPPDAAFMFCRLRALRFFSKLLNIRTSEARETVFTKDGTAGSSLEVFYYKRATVKKGQELMEAISKRGEIGFLDSAAKPVNYVVAAAEENLSAARLANDELIFVAADSLMATAFDKFRFAESFQDIPHRCRATQTSIGGGHTESNRTKSNPANFNQQNLMEVDARKRRRRANRRSRIAEEIVFGGNIAETGSLRVRKIRREDAGRIDEPGKKKRSSFGNFSTAARAATRAAATA